MFSLWIADLMYNVIDEPWLIDRYTHKTYIMHNCSNGQRFYHAWHCTYE